MGYCAMATTRRLAAILAADVAGYSRLMEPTTRARTNGSRRIPVSLDPKIKKHNCRTVENTGDGLLTELPSVVEATRCAVEMRRAIHEQNTGVKGLWARGEWAQD